MGQIIAVNVSSDGIYFLSEDLVQVSNLNSPRWVFNLCLFHNKPVMFKEISTFYVSLGFSATFIQTIPQTQRIQIKLLTIFISLHI
jgi:hypothetical protein